MDATICETICQVFYGAFISSMKVTMIEVMISQLRWRNRDWIIVTLDKFSTAYRRFQYFDGSVPNIFVAVKEKGDYRTILGHLFGKFEWLDEVLLRENDDLVDIYCRHK